MKQFKVKEINLGKTIYEIWIFLDHPFGKVFCSLCDKKYGFSGERVKLSAAELDKIPSMIIASVVVAISQKYYDWVIIELIKGGGCGENDASISFDKEKNKACFEFNFCLPEGDPHAEITYTDSVKLFHAYFNAYKKFVEECAPEIKEKLYFYTKKKWYPRFLEALEKLNKYYEEMVEIEK